MYKELQKLNNKTEGFDQNMQTFPSLWKTQKASKQLKKSSYGIRELQVRPALRYSITQ